MESFSIDWSVDWSIDRLIDFLIDWMIDWLIDWLILWSIDWLIDWLIDWFFMVGYDGVKFLSKWCRCLGNFPFFRRACERWSFVRLWATISRREKWSKKLMRSGHCSDGMPLSRMQSWAGGRKWRHWRCPWWRPTPMTQRYHFFLSIVPNISLNTSNSIFNFI